MSKKKVYCINCKKFRGYIQSGEYTQSACSGETDYTTKGSAIYPPETGKIYLDPLVANAKNNCKQYEEKDK
jgi:hypothetical protein